MSLLLHYMLGAIRIFLCQTCGCFSRLVLSLLVLLMSV